jgi:hypothetical protein
MLLMGQLLCMVLTPISSSSSSGRSASDCFFMMRVRRSEIPAQVKVKRRALKLSSMAFEHASAFSTFNHFVRLHCLSSTHTYSKCSYSIVHAVSSNISYPTLYITFS